MFHARTAFRLTSWLLVLAMLVALLPPLALSATPVAAAAAEVFISEIIEGSSYNKAIEIYNGTGAAIDLAAGGYSIQIFFNGSASAGTTINLTGVVADGDVYVVADDTASAAILAQTDQTSTSNFFNGDDAVVLRKGTAVIDSIGQVGFDPGSEWGSGLTSTQDNTLRRKAAICAGDTVADDVFDPAVEWDGYAIDTFDGLGSHTAACAGPVDPKINEFVANHTGTDYYEYVEIFGSAGADYSAYSILHLEGDGAPGSGFVDSVDAVGTTDALGFWVTPFFSNRYENGTITFLLVEGFSGAVGTDLDTNDDGILDSTPWTRVVDGVAVTDGGSTDRTYAETTLAPNFDGVSFVPGGASRFPDGADTGTTADWVRNDFDGEGLPVTTGTLAPGEAKNTPGYMNELYVAPPEVCGNPATLIHDIQGSGSASPIVDTELSIEGVVVGDYQPSDSFRGFYLQEEDFETDADPLTSEGVFVYDGGFGVDVALGDIVRVRGTVTEYNGLTEITGVSTVLVCSTGAAVTPTEVTLPVASLSNLEAFEGMLITIPQELTVSENYNLGRYGELFLSVNGRQYQGTHLAAPGAPALAQTDLNLRSRILLDDGNNFQNIDPTIYPSGGLTAASTLRSGYLVHTITGVLDYRFSAYRLQPVGAIDFDPTGNLRTAVPDEVGGTVKVASFNVLNYFTTIDTGAWICGPTGGMECRGADSLLEFERQRLKIISALIAMDADVVGLIEIENDAASAAVQDLVNGLNDALGAGTYAYVDTGAIGTDAIKVALIYKTTAVMPSGAFAILDTSVDPTFLDDLNRPVLAQTFADLATGGEFTVAVNHLKSKGSDCNDVGDYDLGDGQGNCNLTRTAAALALANWLMSDPTDSGDPDYLIIGDLNSYAMEDPIVALENSGYTDLLEAFHGPSAYSYVFEGQSGYLDYGLASPTLLGQVTGIASWHINTDEPRVLDYNVEFKTADQIDYFFAPDAYRASDHDALVIGLDLSIVPYLYVSGLGAIDSPAGAYLPDPSLSGRATFAFVARYLPGARLPLGKAQFQFEVADLTFLSTSLDWLVVNRNKTNAQFKGTGTINGAGSYKFMIWAGDGDPDTFRIKIWYEDTSGEVVVYDNGVAQPITEGKIYIRK